MKSISELTKRKNTSLLLMGVSGTGKTALTIQFPDPFVLDCDDNLNGPVKYLTRNGVELKNVSFGSPYSDNEGNPLPREKWFPRAGELLSEAIKSPCKTIVIDSLTSFSDLVLIEVLRLQGRSLSDVTLSTKGSRIADEQMQIQDWGMFFNAMKSLVMKLKASGKTVVFNAHTKSKEDNLTKSFQTVLACPGQTSDLLAGFFEEVWLLENTIVGVGKTAREQRTVASFPPNALTKSLGLKSPSGLPSGTKLDAAELISYLFPNE